MDHKRYHKSWIIIQSNIKDILRPSFVCFILRYSSNWNPQRLHSEPLPPKEKHNVGPVASMTTTTTLVSVLPRFEYLAEGSNVLDHYNFLSTYDKKVTRRQKTKASNTLQAGLRYQLLLSSPGRVFSLVPSYLCY
jgi:hypothetical protein